MAGLIASNDSSKITAIPSVWDDGGSSGRLRNERGALPPGDIRQCLISCIEEPAQQEVAQKLFDDRLADIEGPFKGHSLGNLIFERLEKIYRGPDRGIQALKNLFLIKANILLHTLTELRLIAKTESGIEIQGETNIDNRKLRDDFRAEDRISRIYFNTKPDVNPQILDSVKKADKIIFSPGDLYTSVLPHLLMQETRQAILSFKTPLYLVLNLMTKSGETDFFKASDHLQAFLRYLYNTDSEDPREEYNRLNYLISNQDGINPKIIKFYKETEGQDPVEVDDKICHGLAPKLKIVKVKGLAKYYHEADLLRHDPIRLAKAVLDNP